MPFWTAAHTKRSRPDFLSQIFIWQSSFLIMQPCERSNHGHHPASKSIFSRKRGIKSPPSPLSLLCRDGDGTWRTDHSTMKRLRDVPSTRVTGQQWKLDPGAGNLVPVLHWAVESWAGRWGPRGQSSKGLQSWLLTPWGQAGRPDSS